jgi:hypothetical protein
VQKRLKVLRRSFPHSNKFQLTSKVDSSSIPLVYQKWIRRRFLPVSDLIFGLWSGDLHGNVTTRKAPRRKHGSGRCPRSEVVIRVPPARSYNAGRAGLVDGGLCTRRAVMVWCFCCWRELARRSSIQDDILACIRDHLQQFIRTITKDASGV